MIYAAFLAIGSVIQTLEPNSAHVTLALRHDDTRCIIHFAEACAIRQVVVADASLFALVSHKRTRQRTMCVFESAGRWCPWNGAIDFEDICAIGRDIDGRLLVALRSHGRPGRAIVYGLLTPGERHLRQLGSFDYEEPDGAIVFLPSASFRLLTRRVLFDTRTSAHVDLEPGFGEITYADISTGAILAACHYSASRDRTIRRPQPLFVIDSRSGHWSVLPMKHFEQQAQGKEPPMREGERVTSILADPLQPGWFYVAVCGGATEGRLLHVSFDGRVETAYMYRGPRPRWIRTLARDRMQAPPEINGEDPVLAQCFDSEKQHWLVTYRGLHRRDASGTMERIGDVEFAPIGGFNIARPRDGLLIISGVHSEEPGDLAAITPRLLMVASPSTR